MFPRFSGLVRTVFVEGNKTVKFELIELAIIVEVEPSEAIGEVWQQFEKFLLGEKLTSYKYLFHWELFNGPIFLFLIKRTQLDLKKNRIIFEEGTQLHSQGLDMNCFVLTSVSNLLSPFHCLPSSSSKKFVLSGRISKISHHQYEGCCYGTKCKALIVHKTVANSAGKKSFLCKYNHKMNFSKMYICPRLTISDGNKLLNIRLLDKKAEKLLGETTENILKMVEWRRYEFYKAQIHRKIFILLILSPFDSQLEVAFIV